MSTFHLFIRRTALVVAPVLLAVASSAEAQVDTLQIVVDKPNATGSKSIASFAYDPSRDEMYVTLFGASADTGNPAIRKVTNVAGGAAGQVSTSWLSESQLQLYYREGNGDRGVSTPLQSGVLLNPKAVGSAPAYSFAFVADNGFTRFPNSTTTDPAATKRFYTYSLQAPPAGGDGRDVFTTRVTLADMQTAAGTTNTSTNQGRQFAWSGNGQSIYFQDSSTVFGGIWRVQAAGGAPTRILTDTTFGVTEPAVVPAAGGVDRIYVAGTTGSGNNGGIDVVTYDGTTATRAPAVTVAALRAFLEAPDTYVPNAASLSADADGNVYFNNTVSSTERRALYRLDPQGRLSKVVGYAERKTLTGTANPNSNMLRQQPRTISYAGTGGSFDLTQVLYADSTLDAVIGVNAFKAGDFNRDNLVNQADANALKPLLTLRGVAQANAANHKFDLNGNTAVDWKDVKVFQQFFPFDDGDVDMGGAVNFSDLNVVRDNYGTTGKVWTAGEFTGDNNVNYNDLLALALHWDGARPTNAEFDAQGYTGQFRTDVEQAFNAVPEPGTAAALSVVAAAGLLRRQRRACRRR